MKKFKIIQVMAIMMLICGGILLYLNYDKGFPRILSAIGPLLMGVPFLTMSFNKAYKDK